MTGVEVAVGWLFAWAVGKARRVAGRADTEVDRGLDAAMDHLHDVVSRKLGQETALARLDEEAADGRTEPTANTRQWLQSVLDDARTRDEAFAEELRLALARFDAQSAPTTQGRNVMTGNTISDSSVQIGDHTVTINNFGTPG